MNNNLFEGIEIFTEVVASKSFIAAAQKLGHSPSHVSKVVARLEERLGVRLLNRTTRTLALTPEGESYYQNCTQLIQDAQAAAQQLNVTDDIPRGTLKITCPVAFSTDYLQPVLAEYLNRYPNVSLEWDLEDKAVDVVGDGYDLAVRATPQLEESSLICKRVYQCKTYVVASPDYISRFGQPHHPKELEKHHSICYSNHKTPDRWEFKDKQGNPFHVDVRQRILCNNGHMQTAMARDGIGIARLPAFYVDTFIAQQQLITLFPDYPQPEVNVYVVYPSRRHLSPKVRHFIDLLSEHFEQIVKSRPVF
ncbi:hypothetical protein PRUB_b0467 [Pseudoalteromonas rubra]|uniref:HTH lysR-type domain-containing protein n=1 Tax=Pseudoalteromonas rubra TaxID=43658 RepID=A0A8T0C219_9GAMM|nr:LysR family transcriptional regulator [Pseudoalteromonas rubra]KAF7781298.1 hypothetical protein PRUB_b0467 [Pseudoalteromonas rubra]